METTKWYWLSLLLIVVSTLSECTVQKRIYRDGYYVSWKKKAVDPSRPIQVNESIKAIRLNDKIQTTQVVRSDKASMPLVASVDQDLTTKAKTLILHTLPMLADTCGDLITLRDGTEILAKVIEVNPNSVKYKLCDNLSGPLISTNVEKVFMIRYVNGSKEVFEQKSSNANQANNKTTIIVQTNQKKDLKLNGFAIASFITALFSFTIIFGVFAVIFGAVGLSQINRYPEKYKGSGFATAGILISLVVMFILLIALMG